MTVQFYNYLAAVEVQPQSVATPTHNFTRARYSFDRYCTTSGTNNRLSGTNSTNPGLSRRFRDSWSLCWCQDAYLLYGMIIVSGSWSGVMNGELYVWIKI